MKRKKNQKPTIRRNSINEQIKAPQLRVVLEDGETLGVISRKEALEKAKEMNLDLIEISPNAEPPVAKIMNYGKFQYTEKKKIKERKSKAHITETKSIQVKVGTGEHDLSLKAKKASEWLKKGHRVKVELYLRGRTKYLQRDFLNERLERVLNLLTEDYKISDDIKKSPKGLVVVIEKVKQINKKDYENKIEDKQIVEEEIKVN